MQAKPTANFSDLLGEGPLNRTEAPVDGGKGRHPPEYVRSAVATGQARPRHATRSLSHHHRTVDPFDEPLAGQARERHWSEVRRCQL